MLKVNNLTKIYTTKRGRRIRALDDVTADFGDSGLVFLLGKSGSGKSTMLNLIGGLDTPSGGEVVINGRSSRSFSGGDFDSYRNTHVGFVFQEYNLIDEYSVGENVGIALELQGLPAPKAVVDEMLAKVGLVDGAGNSLYRRRTTELSGGQKQRVAIARALVKSPDIILADEPTGALDSVTGAQLYELLKELSKEKLIVVVSHDRDAAEKYGDRILEIADGRIIKDSTDGQPTGENKNVAPTPFLKSSLPFKRCFTMGASALLTKRVRLVTSILMSVIAFVMFGFSLTAGRADEFTANFRTMYDNGHEIFLLDMTTTTRTDAQYAKVAEYNGGKMPARVLMSHANYYSNMATDNSYHSNLWDKTSRFAVILENEEDAKLTPDERFLDKTKCRLPQASKEIAITDFLADQFMRYGFVADVPQVATDDDSGVSESWTTVEQEPIPEQVVERINTPDDLIGKKVRGYTIVGVYSTEMDLDYYREYDLSGWYDDAYINGLVSGMEYSMLSARFVYKDYMIGSEDSMSYDTREVYLLKTSGDIAKDRALIDALTTRIDRYGRTDIYEPMVYSSYSWYVDWVRSYRHYASMVVLIIAAVIAVFAILLTINFLTASIAHRTRELGILRALGARKKDVLLVCLTESGLLAAVEFVLSFIIILTICLSVNAANYISVLVFGWLEIGALLLICFGTAALATIFPVVRIASKKPVDVIRAGS